MYYIYLIYIHLSRALSQLYINHADIETCVDGADRGKPWWHQGASGKRYLVGRFRFLGACKSPQHAVRTRLEFQVCGFGINLWKRCGSKIWDLLKLHWLVCAHGLESNFWTRCEAHSSNLFNMFRWSPAVHGRFAEVVEFGWVWWGLSNAASQVLCLFVGLWWQQWNVVSCENT